MQSETLLFGFDVVKNMNIHKYCVNKHCVAKGTSNTRACINSRLAEHMAREKKILKFRGKIIEHNESSDWILLDKTLSNSQSVENQNPLHSALIDDILTCFSHRGSSYGLRYEYHGELGKSFVIDLLQSSNRLGWGKDFFNEKIEYSRLFSNLYEMTKNSSCGGIYRLYDLLQGDIKVRSESFNTQQFLSLIYAFGYTDAHPFNAFPKSIGELVAKYQFFYEFSEKAIEENNIPTFSQADYLKSTFPFVNRLWYYYSLVSAQLFSVDNNVINHPYVVALYEENKEKPKILSKDQQLSCLRTAFSGAIQQNCYLPSYEQTLSSPVPFKSNFEATYHPFKHARDTAQFFKRINPITFDGKLSEYDLLQYTKDGVSDYLHMIKDIIKTSDQVTMQPDQFTPGMIFKFNKKLEIRKKSFQVIVRSYIGGISYILTCY